MEVYIWEQTKDNWGHASLRLSDGTYISWWPKTSDKGGQKWGDRGGASPSLQADIEAEGKRPDSTYRITGLNEEKIRAWWSKFRTGNYSLIFKNCCSAVREALCQGGARQPTGYLIDDQKTIHAMCKELTRR